MALFTKFIHTVGLINIAIKTPVPAPVPAPVLRFSMTCKFRGSGKKFKWKPERWKNSSMENFRTGAGVLVAIFMSPTVCNISTLTAALWLIIDRNLNLVTSIFHTCERNSGTAMVTEKVLIKHTRSFLTTCRKKMAVPYNKKHV